MNAVRPSAHFKNAAEFSCDSARISARTVKSLANITDSSGQSDFPYAAARSSPKDALEDWPVAASRLPAIKSEEADVRRAQAGFRSVGPIADVR